MNFKYTKSKKSRKVNNVSRKRKTNRSRKNKKSKKGGNNTMANCCMCGTEINKKESEKEVYKKMSLSALKTLVISKGLCSDASKLKKHELLKLLENIEE